MKTAWRNTIGDLLRRSAGRMPDKEALIFEERRWTYRQLEEMSNRLARQLLELGLRRRGSGSGLWAQFRCLCVTLAGGG